MSEAKISVLGAGRMGQEILQQLAKEPGEWRHASVWLRAGNARDSGQLGQSGLSLDYNDNLAEVLCNASVAVDFSLPEATPDVLNAVIAARVPLVSGVSGLSDTVLRQMAEAAKRVPVFYDRNMSIGIALLKRAAADAARLLGTSAAVTINDLHHAKKLDAPSGTALMLGEAVAEARGQDFSSVMHYDQANSAQLPTPDAIRYNVRREGSYPGTHSVEFQGDAETLRLVHEVSERAVFAIGALRAARWLRRRPAGLYSMQDMIAVSAEN